MLSPRPRVWGFLSATCPGWSHGGLHTGPSEAQGAGERPQAGFGPKQVFLFFFKFGNRLRFTPEF